MYTAEEVRTNIGLHALFSCSGNYSSLGIGCIMTVTCFVGLYLFHVAHLSVVYYFIDTRERRSLKW